jgi:cation diffusion facilitator CzcD-associated flavoprotein CzcO
MTSTTATTETEIAIVGAGLAGIGMAIALRRAGVEDFVVLERAAALGGTWRDNSYPGCACDIPSVLYAYRDAPNPQWTHAYAHQPEIWAYMRRIAAEHDLERFIRYDHELADARFDEVRQRWMLQTRDPRGERPDDHLTASLLISGTGALADPATPELPGLNGFGGTTFHSARWDHGHALDGARIAVIGTGASAIQFVPEIQPRAGRLTLFQRTPPWVLPRNNPTIPPAWRERFARYPRLQDLARSAVFSLQESTHVGFRHPLVMKVVERQVRGHIAREVADPQLRARLTPDYRLGCKRVLGSDRWYPALVAPNVDVVSTGIGQVVADGIVDGQGVHHPADTIIFGTGFHVTDPPIAERIAGRDGRRLSEIWGGSPRAHLGMSIAGFPNLFLLLGPNTGLGHNSVLVMIEAQIAYVRRLLRHRTLIGAATVEPTVQAQAASIAAVDHAMQGSVWTAGGCSSWYLDRSGRNSALWPGSVRAYERRLAHLDPDDYVYEPPGARSVETDPQPALDSQLRR